MPPTLRWDIFCDVVDNFGDAGVCARLARQLAAEHQQKVRIFTNKIALLQNFLPHDLSEVLTLHDWDKATHSVPGNVVIEAFACTLPEGFIQSMAACPIPPIWINFEYLALEAWANECHTLPSPHPRLPLTKHFFIPGMSAHTGGLLRERNILERRDAFLQDTVAQNDFWQRNGHSAPLSGTRLLSLFAYENEAVTGLFDALAHDPAPSVCLIPQGRIVPQVAAWLGLNNLTTRTPYERANLTLIITDFLTYDDYDRLLWLCDLNFVRGEDSLVRALWAGKPFLWQAYPQAENAHFDKLEGLVATYTESMPVDLRAAWVAQLRHWNGNTVETSDWPGFFNKNLPLSTYSLSCCQSLSLAPDCTHQLMEFVAGH